MVSGDPGADLAYNAANQVFRNQTDYITPFVDKKVIESLANILRDVQKKGLSNENAIEDGRKKWNDYVQQKINRVYTGSQLSASVSNITSNGMNTQDIPEIQEVKIGGMTSPPKK